MSFFNIVSYLSGLSWVFWGLFESLQTSSARPERGPGVRAVETHTVPSQHPDQQEAQNV